MANIDIRVWRADFHTTKAGKSYWIIRDQFGKIARTPKGPILAYTREDVAILVAKNRNERNKVKDPIP